MTLRQVRSSYVFTLPVEDNRVILSALRRTLSNVDKIFNWYLLLISASCCLDIETRRKEVRFSVMGSQLIVALGPLADISDSAATCLCGPNLLGPMFYTLVTLLISLFVNNHLINYADPTVPSLAFGTSWKMTPGKGFSLFQLFL